MNRVFLITILVLANAIPVAFFGMKVFDAINPKPNVPPVMIKFLRSDLDEQIERMRMSLEVAVAEYPHDLKAIEAKRKALEELLREQQEEKKRLEEQRERNRHYQRSEDIML